MQKKPFMFFLIFLAASSLANQAQADNNVTTLNIQCRVLCSPLPCRNSTLQDRVGAAIVGNMGDGTNTTLVGYTIAAIYVDQVQSLFPMYGVDYNILADYYLHDLLISVRSANTQSSDSVVVAQLHHVQNDLYRNFNYVNLVLRIASLDNPVGLTTAATGFDAIPILLYHISFVLCILMIAGLILAVVCGPRSGGNKSSGLVVQTEPIPNTTTLGPSKSAEYTPSNIQYITTPRTFAMTPITMQFQNRRELDLKLF